MIILEVLVAGSCFYGNGEACNSSLNSYVKYNKIDERAQHLEEDIKKTYPSVHLMGSIIGTAIQRKYNFMIHKGFWYQGDYSDIKSPTNMILYKYSF